MIKIQSPPPKSEIIVTGKQTIREQFKQDDLIISKGIKDVAVVIQDVSGYIKVVKTYP